MPYYARLIIFIDARTPAYRRLAIRFSPPMVDDVYFDDAARLRHIFMLLFTLFLRYSPTLISFSLFAIFTLRLLHSHVIISLSH